MAIGAAGGASGELGHGALDALQRPRTPCRGAHLEVTDLGVVAIDDLPCPQAVEGRDVREPLDGRFGRLHDGTEAGAAGQDQVSGQ